MDIKGKVFLVTGGASGLGAATAKVLTQRGASVTVVDLPHSQGEVYAKELGHATFAATDVTDADSVQAAIDKTVATFGRLDGAVNCAGVGTAMKIANKGMAHDLDLFRRVIEVNLIGTFNVLRLVAVRLQANTPDDTTLERGVLINTASIAAYDGQIGQAAYAASKGGVVSLTLPAARDLSRDGIRVVTIAPGIFDTPMLAMLPQEAREKLGQQVPFPSRLGDPIEFGGMVATIIETPMLNGEVIRLDGALRMPPK